MLFQLWMIILISLSPAFQKQHEAVRGSGCSSSCTEHFQVGTELAGWTGARCTFRLWIVRWCRDSWIPHNKRMYLLKWSWSYTSVIQLRCCSDHYIQFTWMKLQHWTHAGALHVLRTWAPFQDNKSLSKISQGLSFKGHILPKRPARLQLWGATPYMFTHGVATLLVQNSKVLYLSVLLAASLVLWFITVRVKIRAYFISKCTGDDILSM